MISGGGIRGWGWFEPSKLYKYGDQVHFIPRFGSTFMFMRKTSKLKRVYDICLDVWKNADKYGFLPLDDQILAVAIAVEDCRCVDDGKKYGPCVYPFHLKAKWHPKPEMHKKQLTYTRPDYNETTHALLCHWGNDLTTKALYKREIHSLNMLIQGNEIRLRIGVTLYNVIQPFSALSTILGNIYKKMLGHIMNNRRIRKLLYPVEICIKKIRRSKT